VELSSEKEIQQSGLSTRLGSHYGHHKQFVIVFLNVLDPVDYRGERGNFNAVDIAINNFEGVSILKSLRQDFIELFLSS